jgi:hypothetical protein
MTTDNELHEIRAVRRELAQWKRIATMAFTYAKGCLDGCRGACMCTCGYEHYKAQVRIDERNAK